MTGAELASLRKAAGLSQTALAQRAGIGRHAVSYWECKTRIYRTGWAVKRILSALGLPPISRLCARAGGWGLTSGLAAKPRNYAQARGRGVSPFARLDAEIEVILAKESARRRAIAIARAARRRVPCKARTRKGTACRNLSEPGKARCKFHGGKSTGPKTPEGKARIAEAQRARWAKWRAALP
jgi:transcriptional regulator with XRE-family HTH domain